jgi:ATP-dependent RNA helicase DDX41
LLREANQKIPPVLASLPDPVENYQEVSGVKGCPHCGGLGHKLSNCPKLESQQRQHRQLLKSGDGRETGIDGGY